jgi:AraC-like DNA-binding protein
MGQSSEESSLCRALQDYVIPWVERYGADKLVPAAASYRELLARRENLPEGMSVRHRPWRGGRKAVRSSRVYGSVGVVNAKWPEDNLQSTRTPKLCFVLSGAIAYPIADYQLVCKAGHGLLLPAGVPFATALVRENIALSPGAARCEILQLLPYQDSLNCWLSTKAIDDKGHFSNRADVACVLHSKVPEYLQNLIGEATRREQFHEAMCRSWLQLIVHELYRELQAAIVVKAQGRSQLLTSEMATYDNHENPMAQAQKYMRRNLARGVSINDTANYVCMSRSVFTEKFRRYTNLSFTEYLAQLRLQEARILLRETDLSIIQISKTVGVTPAWLRALFQQEYSLSPSQYRERHKLP